MRLAILASGRGSNLVNLVERLGGKDSPVTLVGAIVDNPDAPVLPMLAPVSLRHRLIDLPRRRDFESALHYQLLSWGTSWIALAGFMRILTSNFVALWHGRIVNIHPSLLPAYPGLNTHARALADGATRHGCSVHLVTSALDAGPVLAHAEVPVLAGDSVESLAQRVLKAEHDLYPRVLMRLARAKSATEARRI
ncbi:MAG TPA: phosphoribosylglycinamide formyltransferase [Dongiaceae bacterium]|jgi:formyltetrahydrofolate-dependent phosphoribosylglycinamide formyltransferase|nr:phosphoribosylglycinamide formyltransferase [Dongiaceae bacterium]